MNDFIYWSEVSVAKISDYSCTGTYSTTRLYKIQRTNLPGFKNLAGLYLTKSGNAIKLRETTESYDE